MKTVPAGLVRFFRAEALERWKLDPDHVASLNGSCDELVALLLDHYDFTIRRALAEVDDFMSVFEDSIKRATGGSSASRCDTLAA